MSEQPDLSPSPDIDQLLEQADPEFTKGLEAVRAVENAADVVIEASAVDLEHEDEDTPERAAAPDEDDAAPGLLSLALRPRELLGYVLGQVRYVLHAFKAASLKEKFGVLALLSMAGASFYLVTLNIRGTWLPRLTPPLLTQLSKHADRVQRFDPKDDVSLTAEFPPELHEFLFKPFKVNLRATAKNPWPMGAFEFIVTVDVKETAIEVRDREVEFKDLVQRVFEQETFHDLATELGKAQLKSRILREINAKLAAGRVTDVHFKTFVLKP